MIDSSVGQRFSEASGICVSLVRVTCSLGYFRDNYIFFVFMGIVTLPSSTPAREEEGAGV